ncbi:MAG: hypothetical protein ABI432_17270 [Flavobacteriales bacterium]
MSTVSSKDLADRMSKRLANFKLSDAAIKGLADRVVIDGLSIGKFNPCIYGICIDYFTDKWPKLDFKHHHGITKWEVFPYGIIDWDRFRVRVAFQVDGIQEGINGGGGF